MTIDPLVVIAAITALGSLLLYFLRMFSTGDLLSKNVVSRADYERVLIINEGYAQKFGEQTESIVTLTTTVERLVEVVSGKP